MDKSRWEQVEGNYFTGGGDPLWRCSVCRDKGSWHVYGVECPENHSHKCPVCGTTLLYPWEENEQWNV